MPFLASYRRILSVPGAALFSVTGLIGRLPISTVGLGIVLLVQAQTGSYGAAGAVSAAYMVANAALAIVQGQLLDRLGQRLIIGFTAVVFGVAMTGFIVSIQADWPRPMSYALAAVAGAALPQLGSCVRARWSYVLTSAADKQTAFALEAAADEVVFMSGPVLVTLLATTVSPAAGLATAAAAGVLGSLAFAAQRATEPPAHPHAHRTGPRPPMPWTTVVPIAVIGAALGILFGAAEVTTVAFADEHGNEAYAGPLLALWALGSLVAGVATGAVTWRSPTATRLRWGALAMATAMAPLAFIDSVPLMGLVLVIGGMAIAPTLVAALTLTEQVVPAARLTEGMAWIQTGLVAGVAPGGLLSGVVVDHSGSSAAYLVSLGAGLVAAAAALTLPRQRTAAPTAV